MKLHTAYLVLSLLTASVTALAQDTVSTAQMAVAAFVNGDIDSASALAYKSLTDKKTFIRLLLQGDIAFEQKKYAKAARCYTAADKMRAGVSGIRGSQAYALAGNYDSAFVSLKAYMSTTERISTAKISADTVFDSLKNDSRWQNLVNQRDINPYQKQLESAEHLIIIKRNSDAYELLNKVIKSHPSYHRAWYLRAWAYYKDDNYKSALTDILQAIKIRNKSVEYINLLAQIYYSLQKYEKAAEAWISALNTDERCVDNFCSAAQSFLLAKDYVSAEKYSRLYLVLFPFNSKALNILSESLLQQGDCTGALRVLNMSGDKNAAFYRTRGLIYLQSETYKFAIDDFNRAIDLDNTLYDVYLHRGLAHYFSGHRQEATNDWNTALKHRCYKANDYLQKYR